MDCQEFVKRGIAHNNARARNSRFDYPKWLFAQAIPTGNPFDVQFVTPKSARRFLLEYVLIAWPVTEVFRPIFIEAYDEKGVSFVNVDFVRPGTSTGAKVTLFSSPGADVNPALAGDQAQYVGMFAVGEEFAGNQVIGMRVFGALAAPDPVTIDFLLLGRQRTKEFYEK